MIHTDTPLQDKPSLALLTFGLGMALTAGPALYTWVNLGLRGTIHPGHYNGLRTSTVGVRTTRRERP